MRSGLHKSGTVPLLALIIFCLLTLVPTLAKEWGLNGLGSGWPLYGYGAQLAYLGLPLPRYDGNGRYSSSRIKNASVETRPRRHLTGENCKPSLFGDLYSSCFENSAQRHLQPHYSAIRTPRSSFEAAAEPGKNPITHSATKEPSTLTRGVSAFKEFVIKRWDDQQMTEPLSRHGSDETAQPTPTDASSATPALAEQQRLSMPADDVTPDGQANAESLLSRLPLLVYDAWQQACHAGGQYFAALTTHSPIYRYFQTLIPRYPAPASTPDVLQPEKQPQDQNSTAEKSSLNNSSTKDQAALELSESIPTPILPPNTSDATAGQSKHPGFRRDSEQMCGSSMAIVIALVAGIIWF
ncbi:uncharacterized protein BDV14DRAFT_160307 [Aspergillus stella-maris]|uniref:uncharacterized protein n=1 Tax=Aspergillus stella-maris TaxID=1810926 RepID=UPI003CCCA418